MTKSKTFWSCFGLAAAAALVILSGGCTELERSGYSAIPQNSPAQWEMQPYGSFRN